ETKNNDFAFSHPLTSKRQLLYSLSHASFSLNMRCHSMVFNQFPTSIFIYRPFLPQCNFLPEHVPVFLLSAEYVQACRQRKRRRMLGTKYCYKDESIYLYSFKRALLHHSCFHFICTGSLVFCPLRVYYSCPVRN